MDKKTINFNKPPVVEVVCGILFSDAELLKSAHVGDFWQLIKSDFPRIEDAPPLDPQVEAGDLYNLQSQTTVSIVNLPPMRRAWFISKDGRNLIQIQGDRFIFNWKRAQEEDSYPSYVEVIKKFEKYLKIFKQFCEDSDLGTPEYRQFELIYVNHITNSNGLKLMSKDSLFVDHMRLNDEGRFLPSPTAVNWRNVYTLPNSEGRLHVNIQTAVTHKPNIEEIIRMDLTARGISKDRSDESRKKWFDLAHEWIINGFADLTSKELHGNNNWDRTS